MLLRKKRVLAVKPATRKRISASEPHVEPDLNRAWIGLSPTSASTVSLDYSASCAGAHQTGSAGNLRPRDSNAKLKCPSRATDRETSSGSGRLPVPSGLRAAAIGIAPIVRNNKVNARHAHRFLRNENSSSLQTKGLSRRIGRWSLTENRQENRQEDDQFPCLQGMFIRLLRASLFPCSALHVSGDLDGRTVGARDPTEDGHKV